MCLPLWGKWIEISSDADSRLFRRCLPLWGKWIEILIHLNNKLPLKRVFPCGGSGLKWQRQRADNGTVKVSSPVGEVD